MDVDTAAGTNKAASGTQVNDRNSRLGVKGSEDLGNGLKAIYKMEFAVHVGSGDTITNRNQYVGLAGGFGTVLMGRHDTPTKMIQAKDLFNDGGLTDNKTIAGGLGVMGKGMENRLSNVVAYVSPSFAGVKLLAALSPKETGGDGTEESSLSDLYSVALTYGSKKSGLYLAGGMDVASDAYTGAAGSAATYEIDNTGTIVPVAATVAGAGKQAEQMRFVAQYATGSLMANAMYQDFGGDALEDTIKGGTNIQANLGYKIGKMMPKLKVSMVERDDVIVGNIRTSSEDSTNYGVGLDYSFGKKTTGYVEYALLENRKGVKDADTTALSVGLLHKF
jgi:predicted porin